MDFLPFISFNVLCWVFFLPCLLPTFAFPSSPQLYYLFIVSVSEQRITKAKPKPNPRNFYYKKTPKDSKSKPLTSSKAPPSTDHNQANSYPFVFPNSISSSPVSNSREGKRLLFPFWTSRDPILLGFENFWTHMFVSGVSTILEREKSEKTGFLEQKEGRSQYPFRFCL